MGQAESQTSEAESNPDSAAQRFTNYTLSDLAKLREAFEQEKEIELKEGAYKGGIDERHFADLLNRVNGSSVPPELASRLFSVFDKDRDGQINFNEFVIGLSVCCRGTLGERIKFLFRVFDANGDGTISRDEMKQILTATMGMRKELSDSGNAEADACAELFAKYDLNNDGCLDLHEFKRIVENHPNILNFLGHDDGSLCYLVALEIVVPSTQIAAKDPELEIRAAKRAINMVARLSKPQDKLVFFLAYEPVNMDLKPPFQPNKVYRDQYIQKVEAYKQELVNHITTVQKEVLDASVATNVWLKKGTIPSMLKGVCDECHADFVLLSQVNTDEPEELATLIKDSHCSLILVK